MKITRCTIHITASNPDATLEDIRAMHKARGFSDVGYHFLVDREGNILKGRPESLTGAHVAGFNSGNIGISYISRGSDTDSNGEVGKYMTPEQYESLCRITAIVCNKYKLGIEDIYGHNDFPKVFKACPCFKVRESDKFLERVKEIMDELPDYVGDIPEQAMSVDGEDAEAGEAEGNAQ